MVPGIDRRIHNATWVSELARVSAYLPDAATTELAYWAPRPVHGALLQNVLTRRDERCRRMPGSSACSNVPCDVDRREGRPDVSTSTGGILYGRMSLDRKAPDVKQHGSPIGIGEYFRSSINSSNSWIRRSVRARTLLHFSDGFLSCK